MLSQCNTFLLHRIVNDKDQELVRRLVPDHIGSLLRELPTLPTRKAILLGWAAPVPVLVEIRKLIDAHCPRSDDPNFWAAWTGQEKDPPPADAWGPIAVAWQGKSPPDASSAAASAAT